MRLSNGSGPGWVWTESEWAQVGYPGFSGPDLNSSIEMEVLDSVCPFLTVPFSELLILMPTIQQGLLNKLRIAFFK